MQEIQLSNFAVVLQLYVCKFMDSHRYLNTNAIKSPEKNFSFTLYFITTTPKRAVKIFSASASTSMTIS